MEPVGVEPGGQGQAVVPRLGLVRVEPELPGVVPRAEEPGVLARPGERPLDQPERQGDAVGDAVVAGGRTWSSDGGVAREIVAGGDPVEVARPPGGSTAGRSGPGGRRAGGSPRDAPSTGRSPACPSARPGTGRCSQIRMPGTAVSIGLNSPRMPSGASGFMSNESCWPSPPLSRITITDFARPTSSFGAEAEADAFRAASRPGRPIPSSPE